MSKLKNAIRLLGQQDDINYSNKKLPWWIDLSEEQANEYLSLSSEEQHYYLRGYSKAVKRTSNDPHSFAMGYAEEKVKSKKAIKLMAQEGTEDISQLLELYKQIHDKSIRLQSALEKTMQSIKLWESISVQDERIMYKLLEQNAPLEVYDEQIPDRLYIEDASNIVKKFDGMLKILSQWRVGD